MSCKYEIFIGSDMIGESNLESEDSGTGTKVFIGEFFPAPAYKKIQPLFWKFGRATINHPNVDEQLLGEYYDAQDKLTVRVLSSTDKKPFLANKIHIVDYSFDEDAGDTFEIHVWQGA